MARARGHRAGDIDVGHRPLARRAAGGIGGVDEDLAGEAIGRVKPGEFAQQRRLLALQTGQRRRDIDLRPTGGAHRAIGAQPIGQTGRLDNRQRHRLDLPKMAAQGGTRRTIMGREQRRHILRGLFLGAEVGPVQHPIGQTGDKEDPLALSVADRGPRHPLVLPRDQRNILPLDLEGGFHRIQPKPDHRHEDHQKPEQQIAVGDPIGEAQPPAPLSACKKPQHQRAPRPERAICRIDNSVRKVAIRIEAVAAMPSPWVVGVPRSPEVSKI